MFTITKIPLDKICGWTVYINGHKQRIEMIEVKSQFGTLTYGVRPEGYDSWVFKEQGGGGAVTVLYTYTPDGELYIGMILEDRPNMGDEQVWCVIGGFIKPSETHQDAQLRESVEEAGINVKAEQLPGLPMVSNRLFFVADVRCGEGVHAYALNVPFDQLKLIDEQMGAKGGFRFAEENIKLGDFKKANQVTFFNWRDAIKITPDALGRAAIAQLLADVL